VCFRERRKGGWMRTTGRGLFAAAAGTAALAGLLFGFDTAVISGVTQAVAAHFALDQVALGTTVSAALWGTLIGAMTAGVPGDRFGARAVLRVLAAFYVISGLGSALAWDWGSLLAFRFIGGLAIGGSSVLAPVYIAEISPAARRGLLVGMFQLAIVVGILVAYISNAAVGRRAGRDLLCAVVPHPAQPALACRQGTRRRGAPGAARDRRSGARSGARQLRRGRQGRDRARRA
jgi:MFS family permease